MPVEMVLTIISKDRPGLVQTLAQVIADHSGNWIDSSMARLGGEFAGILRVDVSERTVASFEKSLAEHGIAVTVRRESAAPRSHGRRVHLNLTGADRPGIVREVSSALARHRVSIDELHTEVRPGSMTGQPLKGLSAQVTGASFDGTSMVQDVRLTFAKPAAGADDLSLVLLGKRTVTVEMPFVLRDVPLP